MLELALVEAIIRRGVYELRIIYGYIYKQLLRKNLIIARSLTLRDNTRLLGLP